MMNWEDVAKACWEEINGLINLDCLMVTENAYYVRFDIDGDWKYAHTRFKWWLQDFCEDNNLDYNIVDCINKDNNNEDSYRAIYEVVMMEKM